MTDFKIFFVFVFNLAVKLFFWYLMFTAFILIFTVSECVINDRTYCRNTLNFLGINAVVSREFRERK